MIPIIDRLYIGELSDCRKGNSDMAVVHCCKDPCHKKILNYSGNLPNTHQNYLMYENKYNLYLNMIDPPIPLFKIEIFDFFFAFMRRIYYNTNINTLIHCNLCESRAPTMALLFLAKELELINNDSYENARDDFESMGVIYKPGKGISKFVSVNWERIGKRP